MVGNGICGYRANERMDIVREQGWTMYVRPGIQEEGIVVEI